MIGIVLFAHGSRDPLWAKPLDAIAHAVAMASPHAKVECAYLELMSPNLGSVVQSMVQSAITSIRIVPMFLGVGKHAREDLPREIADLKNKYPGCQFELMPAIGEHPLLIAAMVDIITTHP